MVMPLQHNCPQIRSQAAKRFVNAMPDAHHFLFVGERVRHERVHAVERADLLLHFDDALVGAAVQRTLESADGGRDCGVEVGQCGNRHARAER